MAIRRPSQVKAERETPSQDPPHNLADEKFDDLLAWFAGVIAGANQDAAERVEVADHD